MAIQAPSGTQLCAEQLSGNYRMHLKCTTGPINVLVLNQDEGVATMVPVPKCPRTSAEHTHAQQPQTEDEAMESSEINDEHSVEKTTEVVASRTQPGEASPVGVEGSVGQSLKTQSGQNSQSDGEPEQTLSGKEETGRSEKNEATSESPMEVCTPVSHESPNKGSSTPQRSDSLAAIVERLHKGNEEKSQDKEDQGDVTTTAEDFMLSPRPIPVLQLSPPPGEKDFFFNLDEKEGVADLYDLKQYSASASS